MTSLAAALAVAFVLVPAQAGAQGFSLDRLHPPPSADDGLALQRPETLGPSRLSARIVLDYAHAPLVVDARSGGESDRVGAIVGHRLVARALLAYGLGESVELHLALPATLTQSGDESIQDAGLDDPPSGFALADPSLGASIRIAGDPGEPGIRLGAATSILFPLGDDDALSGDGALGITLDLLAAYALPGDSVAPVATVGFAYRPERELANATIGSELRFGAGVHVVPAEIARVVVELHGASAFDFTSAGTALELATGVQLRVAGLVLDAGFGLGLTSAPGTPDIRAILAAGWTSPAREREPDHGSVLVGAEDPDADGVLGHADRCPFEPEDRDRVADEDGCPDADTPPEPAAPGVRFTETHVEPPAPILFEAGSTDLDDADRESLRAVAAALSADASIRFVQLEGHSSGEGTRRRQLSLSERRAVNVQRFLIEQGVAEDRLGAVGNGDAQPLDPDDHARNRRVELRIVERATD